MVQKSFASLLVALGLGLFASAINAATSIPVIEYYHATLDHYFITSAPKEISALDSGIIVGWKRTGKTFTALDSQAPSTTPVCRFYMPPALGDSHFYSASPSECADVQEKFPGAVYESDGVMYLGLPNPKSGACLPDWAPVYRLWNNRADSNHRYTTDRAVRDQMLAKGYVAEGYGPNSVSMCAAPAGIRPTSPNVTLTASPTSLVVPGTVSLTVTATGNGAAISQVFVYAGAKSTPAKSSPPYTFSYNVTTPADLVFVAVAIDVNGVKGYSNSVAVSATAPPVVTPPPSTTPPGVSIVATQTAPDSFNFSSSVAGTHAPIVSYAWNFGDGGTASGASTTHRYTTSGTYTVVLRVTDSQNAVMTATSTVTAVVSTAPPAPPPPPPPVATSDRVLVSGQVTGTNWLEASHALHASWTQGGGDWLDKNGTYNGPTPTISQKISANPMSIDISSIDGDLLLQGIQGWDSATIDGKAAQGFWTDPTSNSPQALPARYWRPSMILNPTRGKMLALTTSYVGQTVRIDEVYGPGIPVLPMVNTGAATPNVKTLTPTTEAAVNAAAGGAGNVAQPWAYDTSVGSINGLPYLRFAITPSNQRGISWFLYHTPLQEVYGRYCIFIEDDVALGMTELGVKLPGLSGTEVSWRMEHGAIAPNNPNVYAAVDYRYAADTGSGYGQITSFNQMFRAGRWYVIEQYAKNNTFTNGAANSDGQGKVWINGNLVWTGSGLKWNAKPASTFNFLHVNVYHGGLGFPTQNIHYRIAGIGISTSYMGPPPELANYVPPGGTTPPPAGPLPTWRQNLPPNMFSPISNTAKLNNQTVDRATIYTWNGLAAGDHSWYAALNGGHGAVENKVIGLDLSEDAPHWTLLHGGTAKANLGSDQSAPYYADGLPAARHTYFQTQVITSRNRVMAFGGYAVNVLAATTPHVDGFDLTAKKWDPAGTWQDSPITHWGVLSVAKDPRTDDVYVGGYGVHAKWTSANATWKTITVGGVSPAWSFEYKGSLVDVNRNEWVQLNGPNLFRIDLTTFVGTKTPVTGAFNTNSDDYEPVVHDLDNDRYLTVKGSTLYAIDPTTYVSTAVCAVPAPENGVQSRLAYFKQLGGVAYLPTFESNVLFMPTR